MPMDLERHRLSVELQRLDWARQLNEEVIDDIAGSAEWMEFPAGQVVIELGSAVNHVYFVISGRLNGVLFDRLGKEIHRDLFGRGTVVGLFSVLLRDQSYLRVE